MFNEMGKQLISLHAVHFLPPQRNTNRVLYTNTTTHTNRPLGISGQYKVESSVIVGSVVYDFLCVRNTDVDCIHYLCGEVTPVK